MSDVPGGGQEPRHIVPEQPQRGVMGSAHQSPETGRAAALGRVTVTDGATVAVVDEIAFAQRFTSDETQPTLRLPGCGDLDR